MTPAPAWLPTPLRYGDYRGDWEGFLTDVYGIFGRDFKGNAMFLGGRRVVYDRRVESGKEEGFWHIVSSTDQRTGERLPDLRRCERVGWACAVIKHADDAAVSMWRNVRSGQIRVLLWLEVLDYLVVMTEKPRVVVLVTAYITDKEHTKQKLRREREEYLKRQTPPRGTA